MVEKVIAFAGNPNVGKSTLFNAMTGLNQHTGNWPGKTVERAEGEYIYHDVLYRLVDLPGTYSLLAHSTEEEIACDYICFGQYDCIVVVCDATCLERNLNLVYQTLEMTDQVIVCINLLDEAKRKGIKIDIEKLSSILKVPVIGLSATHKQGIERLQDALATYQVNLDHDKVIYPMVLEYAVDHFADVLPPIEKPHLKWIALRLLENECFDKSFEDILENDEVKEMRIHCRQLLKENIQDQIIHAIIKKAEKTSQKVIFYENKDYQKRDNRIDQILTSKITGIPIMLLLLCFIFWLTIYGSNIPSAYLSSFLFQIEDKLAMFVSSLNMTSWFTDMMIHGMYHVLAWVISVMLPPMAIFFPLFTLLEDFGYLPRVAFNLDHYFKKACTCGKQALTMCMGFGCNAAGVIGCRIIDSPRERLIAMITNNFVPCNGRFPTLIVLMTMFFIGTNGGIFSSILSALLLTSVVFLGVFLTFLSSKLLSKTLLKGTPSSFTLELPPYRKPQIGKVIVRSILDRTLYVLGRAIVVAAPAGILIWILANVIIGDMSILAHVSSFLDPFGRLIGMDGVIVLAFILGFPANEIVVPIIIMAYLSQGTLIDLGAPQLYQLLVSHGWTWVTALCTILFCLLHWPCSTTCLTIKKESQSWKWTLISFLLPTLFGIGICFTIASLARLFGV